MKCDWLRPVVFQSNFKYFRVKITVTIVVYSFQYDLRIVRFLQRIWDKYRHVIFQISSIVTRQRFKCKIYDEQKLAHPQYRKRMT